MEKINFTNGKAPALNAINLNQLQTNVEEAIENAKTEVENTINEVDKKVDEIIKGTLVSENGTTINYGSYIIYGKLLILVASVTATKDITQYNNIASLSNIGNGLSGNCYIYDDSNTSCYLNKTNGKIGIYKQGGLKAGETITWTKIFALTS